MNAIERERMELRTRVGVRRLSRSAPKHAAAGIGCGQSDSSWHCDAVPAITCRMKANSHLARFCCGFLAVVGLVCGHGVSAGHGASLTVFAATSLTDALRELAARYEQKSGEKIRFNFAASSTLARQIEEGAPADLFFSADDLKMDALSRKGFILDGTRTNRLSNSLVIITPTEEPVPIRAPADLTNAVVRRIALADPRATPAGVYSKAYLEQQRLWAGVESRVVPTENVRAALAAVASGNVDAGMVFKTDAAISKRVRIAFEIPRAQGPRICYPMAVVKDSNRVEAARQFLHYLSSDEAADVFQQYGFVVLP